MGKKLLEIMLVALVRLKSNVVVEKFLGQGLCYKIGKIYKPEAVLSYPALK